MDTSVSRPGSKPNAWAQGSTSAWRKLRAEVLAANRRNTGGACQLKYSPNCTNVATHVHHKTGAQVTGVIVSPKDLLATCSTCNLSYGDPRKHTPAEVSLPDWMDDL